MLITLLEVENFKRIHKVSIAPGERSMILVAGANGAGKSSLMGAMTAALGGGKQSPDEPIRRGAKKAKVRIEIDGGELVVERKFGRSGTTLEVRSKDGKLSSPQKILDGIVGKRFLDPIKFTRLTERQQREVLLGCVDLGIDLDIHASLRKTAYDKRAEANRDVKRLSAEAESLPDPGDVPAEVLTDDLLATLDAVMAKDADRAAAVHELAKHHGDVESRKRDLEHTRDGTLTARRDQESMLVRQMVEVSAMTERHKREQEAHTSTVEGLGIELAARETAYADFLGQNLCLVDKLNDRIDQDFSAEIVDARTAVADASDKEANRVRLLDQSKRLDRALLSLADAEGDAATRDRDIVTLDEKKAAALVAAKMPIEGLDIDEDQVLYNGVPLSQASGAEQLRVSLAIAASLSPNLRDIWVEDGALLDESSLGLVHEFAKANGLRIWLERVGTSDDDCVIISEGKVLA